jgi:hypothetical protein
MRCGLYGIFFSSKVRRTLWENGPENKRHNQNNTKIQSKPRKCNEKQKEGVYVNIQSPRTSGAPAAALTATSSAICLVSEWDVQKTVEYWRN